MSQQSKPDPSAPVAAIGGIGGSGTRGVAGIVNELGFEFAPDLNDALDTLRFTLFFKYREAYNMPAERFCCLYEIFRTAMTGNASNLLDSQLVNELLVAERSGQHPRDWLKMRLDSLNMTLRQINSPWGWKEPNTHIFLDKLLTIEPRLAYIHVVRNGLDMAFSSNQNQLRLWGPLVLGDQYEDSPSGSLRFWCWANERVLRISEAHPGRVLMVSFEHLCRAPERSIQRIAEFLLQDLTPALLGRLAQRVNTPSTVGRSALHSADSFSSCLRSRASEIDALLEGAFTAYARRSGSAHARTGRLQPDTPISRQFHERVLLTKGIKAPLCDPAASPGSLARTCFTITKT